MSSGPEGRRRAPQAGPFLVLLPALLLAIVAALLLRRPPSFRRLAPPEVSDPDEAVPAWAGRVRGADGGSLEARLTPLHADPARQSFEAASLRRRLDLPEGEPWRLSLRWETPAASGSPGSSASRGPGPPGPARGEAPARDPPAGLALGPVEVRDGQGAALTTLAPASPAAASPAADGPVRDPLRALLGPPTGALRPGHAVDWILWGREPGSGARVVGLLPPEDAPGAADFERTTGLRGPLRLEPGSARRSDLVVPVARLDRSVPASGTPGGGGKIPPTVTSEEHRGTRRPEDD